MPSGTPEQSDRRTRRTLVRAALISLVVVVALIVLSPVLGPNEMATLDGLYRLRPPRQPSGLVEVVDVGTDPAVYEHWRGKDDAPATVAEIPRRAYAETVRRLNRWGAKAIVFDLMFRAAHGPEDADLARAFHDAGNVVVAASTRTKPGAVGLAAPIAPFDKEVWGVGSPVAYQPHSTIRSVPLVLRDETTRQQYLALPLLAFQCFVDAAPSEMELTAGHSLMTGGRELPLLPGEGVHLLPVGGDDAGGGDGSALADIEVVRGDNVRQLPAMKTWNTLLINWVGPGGTIEHRFMDELLALDDAQGRQWYSGKAVIIGRSESDTKWDEHWTAVGKMRGPEVQANALDTLISGAFIRRMNPWAVLGLLTAFAAATTLVVQRLRALHSVLAIIALMLFAVVLSRELFVRRGVWMYLFMSELSIALAWGATIALESEKVTGLLSRFVPSFLGDAERQTMGEVRTLDASILWSDIRSFTGISEQVAPEDMLRLLHSYHSAVEDIITKHGGTIVKTPGDAVLAVFWRDVNSVNHATCALRAGREIVDELPGLSSDWEAAGIDFGTGVGINAGSVAMGLVGKQHLEPTVIGDPVNVAQRLETLTKDFHYPLIFSESVRERLEEDVPAVCLDEVTVKGRTEPIRIYGVGGHEAAAHRGQGDAAHA
ncbi:MAG: adenylate/guanylate cyclase domain-containing protein, partial [Armatimonadota bacterium]